MSDEILIQKRDRITEITLNRPEAGNGVTNEMAATLGQAIAEAGESHFVVLRGAGDDFCTGRAVMGRPPEERPGAYERRAQSEVIFDCYAAFRRSPVPVVGLVQGRAAGFGCALAALCDITLASASATFQLPEMGHNIMPTMAMSSLVDRVPRKALMYMVYSTGTIDAQKALSFGIVSDVVPADELESSFEALCAALEKTLRPAILAVKEYARSALSMDIASAVDFARNLHATANSAPGMRG